MHLTNVTIPSLEHIHLGSALFLAENWSMEFGNAFVMLKIWWFCCRERLFKISVQTTAAAFYRTCGAILLYAGENSIASQNMYIFCWSPPILGVKSESHILANMDFLFHTATQNVWKKFHKFWLCVRVNDDTGNWNSYRTQQAYPTKRAIPKDKGPRGETLHQSTKDVVLFPLQNTLKKTLSQFQNNK